jgi:hypothetical protein
MLQKIPVPEKKKTVTSLLTQALNRLGLSPEGAQVAPRLSSGLVDHPDLGHSIGGFRVNEPPVALQESGEVRPDLDAQFYSASRVGDRLGGFSVNYVEPAQIIASPLIQRQENPEEEKKVELQAKPDDERVGPEGGKVPAPVESAISRARGGGQPLEERVQAQMSQSLGHDFSGVRVHTDAEADGLNRQLQAKAFTTGQDIFFKQGTYNPSSSGGRELLTHELTHVIQQSTGRVSGNGAEMTTRPTGDVFEQEADSKADGGLAFNNYGRFSTLGGKLTQVGSVQRNTIQRLPFGEWFKNLFSSSNKPQPSQQQHAGVAGTATPVVTGSATTAPPSPATRTEPEHATSSQTGEPIGLPEELVTGKPTPPPPNAYELIEAVQPIGYPVELVTGKPTAPPPNANELIAGEPIGLTEELVTGEPTAPPPNLNLYELIAGEPIELPEELVNANKRRQRTNS